MVAQFDNRWRIANPFAQHEFRQCATAVGQVMREIAAFGEDRIDSRADPS